MKKKSFWTEFQGQVEYDSSKALQIDALKLGWELPEWALSVDKCVLEKSTLTLVFATGDGDVSFEKRVVLAPVVSATWQMDFTVMKDWREDRPWAIVTNFSLGRNGVEDLEFHLLVEGFALGDSTSWGLKAVFKRNCFPKIKTRTIKF